MSAPAAPSALLPGIGLTEADGVPVLLAPREGNTGGGIMFRVGTAHETLATAGVTHLVEHLALQSQVLSEAHLNGQTRPDVTLFHVAGSTDVVVRYLNDVTAALRDGLPLDRLETEKEILRSEGGLRDPGFVGRMRLERHGATAYGLRGYGERGIDRLTAPEVAAWAATWFTRQNAIAWITADALPAGLDLRLPEGQRMPAPPLTNVLPRTPAFLTGLGDGVVVDAVVPRRDSGGLPARVVEEVLHRDLRRHHDIADQVRVEYDVLDPAHARVTITVQAPDGKQTAAAGAVADALGRLRHHVSDADLDAARANHLDAFAEAEAAPPAALLPMYVHRALTGLPLETPAQARTRSRAVTADDVRTAVAELWSGALWYSGGDLSWCGVESVPLWSADAVSGYSYPRADDPDVALVLGADGVSLTTPDGVVTVRFADCVLLEVVPDGARALTGADGFRVVVEPSLYAGLDANTAAYTVDARVRPEVVVRLPERDPDEIPVPGNPDAAGGGASGGSSGRGEARVLTTIGLVAALAVGVVMVLGVGQGIAEALLGREIRLGPLPLLALVLGSVLVVRRRHGKGAGR